MQAAILDLRRNTRGILSALARNERIVLTNRGKKQGYIISCGATERRSVLEHPAFGMWKDRQDMENVAEYVRNLRKGRQL